MKLVMGLIAIVVGMFSAVNLIAGLLFAVASAMAVFGASSDGLVFQYDFYFVCFLVFMALLVQEIIHCLLQPRTFATRIWPHILAVISMPLWTAFAGFVLYQTNFVAHPDWAGETYWFFNIFGAWALLYNVPSFIMHTIMLFPKNRLDAEKFLDRIEKKGVVEEEHS